MLRKFAAGALMAGVTMGTVMMAAPAQANGVNNNLQLVPIQLCNANVGVLGAAIPVFSPQTTKNCTNGPVNTNIQKHHHHKKHHGYY
ncbi:hypothetical protein HNR23_005153 [Nocardiopsis mwathae]|uniref:Chaplin n=1 Tax=Nocardiopsis mwathae TaxID=1472723 RepID=A0A7W9YMU5_9ACTN|nr:hypothetical protein [Nocardiopsis mwathae]MBB6175093.1 hypothetical protein [Nocardiopsis mwathae]